MKTKTSLKAVVATFIVAAFTVLWSSNAFAFKLFDLRITDTGIAAKHIDIGSTALRFQNVTQVDQTIAIDVPGASPQYLCETPYHPSCAETTSWTVPAGKWLETTVFDMGQVAHVTVSSADRTATTIITASSNFVRGKSAIRHSLPTVSFMDQVIMYAERPVTWGLALVLTNVLWALLWLRRRRVISPA